ncbi:hypothetical protein E2C01_069475 [Portunus trituberculatus]|uniref:Uncharacterized protein n=1 Tax=Portunus trituberculatus TaxID=210409 RepID=A0A5B7HRM8_PORTR|nr:hypothetical protein [Portunus trituberculatus]
MNTLRSDRPIVRRVWATLAHVTRMFPGAAGAMHETVETQREEGAARSLWRRECRRETAEIQTNSVFL